MADFEREDDEISVAKFAQHAIIAHAVPPDPCAVAGEALASVARVTECRDFVEVVNYSACDLPVELAKLA